MTAIQTDAPRAPLLADAFTSAPASDRLALASALQQAGAPLILFPAFAFALGALWLMTGASFSAPVGAVLLLISAIAAFATVFAMNRTAWRPLAAAAALLIAIVCLAATFLVHDTSIDGQHYHFHAVYALAQGWNPFSGAPQPAIGEPVTPWSVHYPRGGWIIAALLMTAGFGVATMKLVNLLVLAGAALIAASALLRFGFSRIVSIGLAFAAVLNPVVLSQVHTAMNDGLLALCLLVFSLQLAIFVRDHDRFALAIALAAMTLGLNLKFSAVPMFALFAALACAIVFFTRGFRPALTTGLVVLATAIVAIFVLGWSPYMTNLIGYGHPFHPVMGPNAGDIMSYNTPPVLEPLNGAQRFLFSLFAETHSGFDGSAALKLPFLIAPAELRAAGGVDVRIAGLGPFFSGVLIVSLIAAITLAVTSARRNATARLWLIVAALLVATSLIMPENWWARYVPQLWFAPLAVTAALLVTGRPLARYVALGLAALMLLNATAVGASGSWLALQRSNQADAQIADMAQTGGTWCVAPDMVDSRIWLMRKAGVTVRPLSLEAATAACPSPQEIIAYGPDRFGGAVCPCADD